LKNILLDTNIYGLIVVDYDRNEVRNSIENKKEVIIYGLSLIRKELRDTPKNIRLVGSSLRNSLLSIYDEITKDHILKLTIDIEELADSYFNVYKEIGGYASKDDIIKDLIIIACASLNSLDIVVSNDNKTMLSEKAIKSYKIVNELKKIRIPRFLDYEEFKKEIR